MVALQIGSAGTEEITENANRVFGMRERWTESRAIFWCRKAGPQRETKCAWSLLKESESEGRSSCFLFLIRHISGLTQVMPTDCENSIHVMAYEQFQSVTHPSSLVLLSLRRSNSVLVSSSSNFDRTEAGIECPSVSRIRRHDPHSAGPSHNLDSPVTSCLSWAPICGWAHQLSLR
jgi:hypothetical protein